MIRSQTLKPIETPKASPKPDSVSNSKPARTETKSLDKVSDKKSDTNSKEVNEFEQTLEESLGEGKNEVQVKVSADQVLELPSTLIKTQENVDTGTPKIFDPELTKGVEKLIQPKTSDVSAEQLADDQVLELAKLNPKMDQVNSKMSKTAGVEIDAQLLSNEDFVAQKNLMSKKSFSNAYGMKSVPVENQKIAAEAGLKQTQVVKEMGAVENPAMNSQQFILGIQLENNTNSQLTETPATVKVLDMGQIKSENADQIINEITNYVVQAKAAKEPTVTMKVAHEDLGMIDITVSKTGVNNEAIAINIGAHSLDGKNFFQQNSKDLMTHLTTSGLSVADLKIETPNQTAKNDFDFGSQSKNQQGQEKQFGSEQNQRKHESDRRQELWKLLNKEAA